MQQQEKFIAAKSAGWNFLIEMHQSATTRQLILIVVLSGVTLATNPSRWNICWRFTESTSTNPMHKYVLLESSEMFSLVPEQQSFPAINFCLLLELVSLCYKTFGCVGNVIAVCQPAVISHNNVKIKSQLRLHFDLTNHWTSMSSVWRYLNSPELVFKVQSLFGVERVDQKDKNYRVTSKFFYYLFLLGTELGEWPTLNLWLIFCYIFI
jgi:hypothetical protein